ncbi:MAG: winged helix-turn-helix domain-containing protein [Bacteroidales bacterium]|nr:winged helix-turn-helix domain-containing protein [Bacteroidales bacterium]
MSPVYEDRAFLLDLLRKELAQISSLSTDGIVRVLKQFEKDKLIRFSGKHLEILDFEKIKKISAWG